MSFTLKLAMQANQRINDIAKWVNFSEDIASEIECGWFDLCSFDGGEDGEHDGSGFVGISELCDMKAICWECEHLKRW